MSHREFLLWLLIHGNDLEETEQSLMGLLRKLYCQKCKNKKKEVIRTTGAVLFWQHGAIHRHRVDNHVFFLNLS